MKATNFLWDEPGLAGAWAKLTHALIFDPLRRDTKSENRPARPAGTRSGIAAASSKPEPTQWASSFPKPWRSRKRNLTLKCAFRADKNRVERRKEPRLKIKQEVTITVLGQVGASTMQASVLDISGNGMRLRVPAT